MSTTTLTDTAFWDDYWKNRPLPDRVDPRFSFDRCLATMLERFTEKNGSKSVFEVGCAPGRWLLFFKEKFGYDVFGIDNSPAGLEKTRENWKAANCSGQLFEGDFMKFESPQLYDLVVSFGFIEHFEQPMEIIAKHAELVKPGGRLILSVPNFVGVNRALQKKINKPILDKHNLSIMNPSFFEKVAANLSLKTLTIEYIGGFEPVLLVFKQKPAIPTRLLLKLGTLARNHITLLDRVNHPMFSCYLTAVYEK